MVRITFKNGAEMYFRGHIEDTEKGFLLVHNKDGKPISINAKHILYVEKNVKNNG